ncbi:hypothetical protein PMZ80_007175 [Knufia obscura]|uniref:Beta-mannosidase B n=1 Tax=Knufia obscura TaxID=1635080 RepID=A0ABR0RKH1_9EURO|nr:hypothetical protein PMZ80_007175 [Knufia obscura]
MALSERRPLEAGWTFKAADEDDSKWLPVTSIPTEVHLDLQANGKIAEPFSDLNELSVRWVAGKTWIYRTTFAFTPAAEAEHGHTDLIFEGLDTFATVNLNGKEILKSGNMFIEHRVNVRNLLKVAEDVENVLEIVFEPARQKGIELVKQHPEHRWIVHQTEVSRAPVRKAQYHWGWDWGPILITCGPWKPIVLHSYTTHIEDLWVEYSLTDDLQKVTGKICAIVSGSQPENVQFDLSLDGSSITKNPMHEDPSIPGKYTSSFEVDSPKLWWPRGYGDQNLHNLHITATANQHTTTSTKTIGFRKAELIQTPDSHGTSFYFRLNNTDIFAGGSCWIPADSFTTRLTPTDYHDWINLMATGNQTMIRVWGGGIYEPNPFYAACDELGILVWQDFMFACANYPTYPGFLSSVQREATQQVRRLRHHPSIVLWAGNNEDYQLIERYNLTYNYTSDKDPQSWLKTDFPARYIYEYQLPDIIKDETTGSVIYHPSSPWGNGESTVQTVDPTVGDIHQWNIWHGAMHPYQKAPELGGRFVSEFGMEGYPHVSTLRRFSTNEEELYPGSLTMEHHNKAIGHSKRMVSYVAENFDVSRASDLAGYAHLTQVMQGDAVGGAYRSWRRDWRRSGDRKCGGVLVWQLNDCWPTVSWAVVDYFLVPKPAYYAMKRALAPVSVNVVRRFRDWTMRPASEETQPGIGQGAPGWKVWQRDTSHVDPRGLYREVVYDVWVASSRLERVEGVKVRVRFISVKNGKDMCEAVEKSLDIEANGTTEVVVQGKGPSAMPGQTDDTVPLDTTKLDPYVIHAAIVLPGSGEVVSEDVFWPEPIKYLRLPDPEVRVQSKTGSGMSVTVEVAKPVKGFVFVERPGLNFSDNGFDVVPGAPKTIKVDGLRDGEQLEWKYVGK